MPCVWLGRLNVNRPEKPGLPIAQANSWSCDCCSYHRFRLVHCMVERLFETTIWPVTSASSTRFGEALWGLTAETSSRGKSPCGARACALSSTPTSYGAPTGP